MGLFNPTQTLVDAGILDGFTDWHCHILPGVDDGFKTLEESLQILKEYEQAGLRSVWFTPHIMEDIPNKVPALKEKFTELKSAYRGTMMLNLASENMLDSLFEERLQSGELLPLEGRRLLVETSFFNPPYDLDGMLKRIRNKGFYPVLAHPERYMYMSPDDYERIKDIGVLFQLNLPSLYGSYGPDVQVRAETLLKDGMYELCGTDLHRIPSFRHLLEAKIRTKVIKQLPE